MEKLMDYNVYCSVSLPMIADGSKRTLSALSYLSRESYYGSGGLLQMSDYNDRLWSVYLSQDGIPVYYQTPKEKNQYAYNPEGMLVHQGEIEKMVGLRLNPLF
jgi:hypothetical protein